MTLRRFLTLFWLNLSGVVFLVLLLANCSDEEKPISPLERVPKAVFQNPPSPVQAFSLPTGTNAPPSNLQLVFCLAPIAPTTPTDENLESRVKYLEEINQDLEKKVGSSFPNIYEKVAADLATIATIITIVAAVLGTIAGVAATLNYLPTFKEGVIDDAWKKSKLAVTQLDQTITGRIDELSGYITARIEFNSSVDMAIAAWNWDKEYAQTSVIHMAPRVFKQCQNAIDKFTRLAGEQNLSQKYAKESSKLLGRALNNFVFFKARFGDMSNPWEVVDAAESLRHHPDFAGSFYHITTYIYGRIVYCSYFAERQNVPVQKMWSAIDQDLQREESKRASLTQDESKELDWLRQELERNRRSC